MKCFYHNDPDGKCSAFWVYSTAILKGKAEFFPMDYSRAFPLDIIKPDEQVYIVDYSIEPFEMQKLLGITSDVTWIDHHKTAIEKYDDFPYQLQGIQRSDVAACMLTFCYLNRMTSGGAGDNVRPFDISMQAEAPLFTKLIADWDVWKMAYGDDTKNFIIAFNAYDFHPTDNKWRQLVLSTMATMELINEGKIMAKFINTWAKEYCRTKGFEVSFEGHRTFAMNLGNCNSEYFKSVEGYDIYMPFCFDGRQWIVSLYSETVDVSVIAKRYGGGGHKGAAGFRCNRLPFVLN